jgi:hypothetical protein
MAVTASFGVRVGHDHFVGEAELSESGPLPADLYGRVWLSTSDTESVFVEDQLVDLVANICFQGLTRLVEDGAFEAYTTRYPGEFRLEAADAETRLRGSAVFTSDGTPNAELVAPTVELLAALHACDQRALTWFHRWLAGDPELLAALDGLDRETTDALTH